MEEKTGETKQNKKKKLTKIKTLESIWQVFVKNAS